MTFQIIRFFLCVIIFICLNIIFFKNKHLKHKNKLLLSFILTIIFTVILSFVPFENAFISFSSPEKAFKYYQSGEIKAILDGNESTMIIADENNTNQITIYPKAKDKNQWKIGIGYNIKNVAVLRNENFFVIIYKYKKSDDYYILISSENKELCEITDNCNSEFYIVNQGKNNYYKDYYAYIKNYNSDYTLFIDGKEIKLDELTDVFDVKGK